MKISTKSLTFWVLLALVLGSVFGLFLNVFGFGQVEFLNDLLGFGGQAFLKLLKLLVVPVVLVSLVCGVSSFDSLKAFGRIFSKSLGLYLVTTAAAITIALTFGLLIKPGEGFVTEISNGFQAKTSPGFFATLLQMIPDNIFSSMVQGEMLQVIVASILLGFSIGLAGQHGKRIAGWFQDVNEVLMKFVVIVMWTSPVGVFCLIAKVFAGQGFDAFVPLLKYFFTVLFVLLLHLFVVYPTLLKTLTRLSPFQFFKQYREVLVFAFSTSSSNATIPVNMEVTEQKLGVHNKIASFTIPFGATINMDGTAIMQGVAVCFIAQFSGIELGLSEVLMVIFTATLASIGTAGVPGVGLITLTMVLTSVGLPVEGVAVILGVDRLLDMTRTAVNVTGDAMVSCIVAKSERLLDEKKFYGKESF